MLADAANQKFLRQEARTIDASKLERNRKIELIQTEQADLAVKMAQIKLREEKRTQAALELAHVNLILDETKLKTLTVAQMEQQLERHRSLKQDLSIPLKSHMRNRAEKLKNLLAVVLQYTQRHAPAASSTSVSLTLVDIDPVQLHLNSDMAMDMDKEPPLDVESDSDNE